MARRSIANCRAVVTGASSGIGWHLALELARHGARLVLVARRRERLEALAGQVAEAGGASRVVAGDITSAAFRREIVAETRSAWGGLDCLINNAGVSAHGRFATSPPERLRQIMEVNFFSAAELTREALPLLRQAARPIVVNIGSILGHRGLPLNSDYCASKFALRGWSESLRSELRVEGIDLLLVSPGTTDTPFFDNLLACDEPTPWAGRRGASPEHLARAIVRGIRRGRREIIPSLSGRLMVCASHLFPRLVDRWVARAIRR